MDFESWLDLFIDEKGIDLEESFEIDGPDGIPHFMDYGVVVASLKNFSYADQQSAKNKMVELDFKNGDIKDFLRYLAVYIIKEYTLRNKD